METIIIEFKESYFKVLEELSEYNTNTSIPHSKSEDIVRPTHITNESVEIRG